MNAHTYGTSAYTREHRQMVQAYADAKLDAQWQQWKTGMQFGLAGLFLVTAVELYVCVHVWWLAWVLAG